MSEIQTSNATRRRDRIKILLGTMVETKEKVLALITEAKDNDDHLDLGYRSWTEYVSAEYATLLADLNREDRRFAAFALSQTGMSTRAIAPILGVSNKTVHQDVAGVTSGNTSSDGREFFDSDEEFVNAMRMGKATDEQFEVALSASRSEGDLSAENVARNVEKITSLPKVVTGTDGKDYPRPEPRARPQSKITDQYWRAIHELEKAVDRVEKLTEDDRFARNRPKLTDYHAKDLARISKRVWGLRKALGDSAPKVTVIDAVKPSADLSLINDVRLYLDALAGRPEVAQLNSAGKGHIITALQAAIETLEAS